MQFYLLSSEVVSYKVLLQFFIGVVDAQLLQVIEAETLKAVHIQNSWRQNSAYPSVHGSLKKFYMTNIYWCEDALTYEVSPGRFICTDAIVD